MQNLIRNLILIILLCNIDLLLAGKYFPPILETNRNNQISPILNSSKDTKKKEQTISNWGANTLTQETKIIEGIEGTVYSLKGGAWILHKKVKLTANSIEILGQDAYKGFLNGSTKVEDLENGITLYAGKGIYDKISETIQLQGRPTLVFKDKQNKITKITSPDLKRNLNDGTTVFENGVIIENLEYTIYSSRAVFYEKDKKLELENRPMIFGKDVFITGEKANHYINSKTTEVEGSAIIIRQSLEKKSKKKNSEQSEETTLEKVISTFTGDKIISKEDTEISTGIFGNAKLYRPDFDFSGSYIKSIGKGNQFLQAKENIEVIDKINNTKLSGDTLEYNKEKNYTHITDNSKIEFLNKETKETSSTLTAVEIERFGNLKEIVCRGNVEIQAEDSTLNGEYATYFEESEKIQLDGNPSITRNKKKVYSGKILIYPKTNKILLTDGLNVRTKK